MKLSEIKGDRQAEILNEIMPLVESLSQNADFNALLSSDIGKAANKETAEKVLLENAKKHLPKLMVSASGDLKKYTALLEGKEEAEITLGDIFQTVIDMLHDSMFLNFFGLYRPNAAGKS